MRRAKDFSKLQKYWNYLRLGGMLLFLLLFAEEIYWVVWFALNTSRRFLGNLSRLKITLPTDFVTPDVTHAFQILCINFFVFFSLIVIAYILIAWHVFPIKDLLQTLPIAWRLFLFTFNMHGPLVYVKNGKIIAPKDAFLKYRPGITIVDHNSAVAIERCFQENKKESEFRNLLFGTHAEGPSIRIAKSGVIFTKKGERILNIPLDIRKQIRVKLNVNAQTRDGLQVTAITFALFTLGQNPNVIQVTCDPKNKKVYVISHRGGSVISVEEELPERDAAHILSYYYRKSDDFSSSWWQAKIADNTPQLEPEYNDSRLLRAVKATAKAEKGDYQYWMDLPIQTVIKAFRNTLQKYTYDYLVQPDDADKFPLMKEIKPYFQRQMTYKGILSYQIVMRKDGKMIELGDQWQPDELAITAPQELPHHTELRKAGIKFIFGSFGTIKPTDEIVQEQFVENWKAQKDMEIAAIDAEYDLKIQRVMQQAESRSIEDSAYTIQSILESGDYNQEALAMLLLRAIKSATMKPGEDGDASRDMLRLIYGLEILNKWFTGEEPDETLKNTIFNLDE